MEIFELETSAKNIARGDSKTQVIWKQEIDYRGVSGVGSRGVKERRAGMS